MILKAYVRLQRCTTKDRRAFVGRRFQRHGIAAGPVDYFAVEASSWAGIRRVLKTFDVMGHSEASAKTVCAYVKDIGVAIPKLYKLTLREVPVAAQWRDGWVEGAPELTSFGASAVEVLDPNCQVAG